MKEIGFDIPDRNRFDETYFDQASAGRRGRGQSRPADA